MCVQVERSPPTDGAENSSRRSTPGVTSACGPINLLQAQADSGRSVEGAQKWRNTGRRATGPGLGAWECSAGVSEVRRPKRQKPSPEECPWSATGWGWFAMSQL